MLFKTNNLDQAELEVIDKIKEMRKALSHLFSASGRWYGLLRKATFARNIRHSNSIEGIHVSRDDALAAVNDEEPMSADRSTWDATVGYRNAMTYALQLAKDQHFSYSEGLIRSLHFMMLQHVLDKHPGRYRPGVIFVYDERKQQRVYEGPDAEQVPLLMGELVDLLNESSDFPAMVRAAIGHLNLAMIHPFSDGNGRMARCLQTLILGREQIIEPPFCSIEECLGRFSQEYYDVLSRVGRGSWHPENDCRPWIRFNLVSHYRQASWILGRARITQRVWDEVEHMIFNRGLPERGIVALVNVAFGYKIRNLAYRTTADVSKQIASKDLKLFVEAGLLTADGETRGRFYIASELLREIYIRNYEPRTLDDPFMQTSLPFPSEPASL